MIAMLGTVAALDSAASTIVSSMGASSGAANDTLRDTSGFSAAAFGAPFCDAFLTNQPNMNVQILILSPPTSSCASPLCRSFPFTVTGFVEESAVMTYAPFSSHSTCACFFDTHFEFLPLSCSVQLFDAPIVTAPSRAPTRRKRGPPASV